MNQQNRKLAWLWVLLLILLALALAAYFYLQGQGGVIERNIVEEAQVEVVEKTIDVNTNVIESSNPLEDKVLEINPIEKANPFSQTYKNPFD